MAITTTCPSCQGPLRIPDELLGQRVRCPVCQNIFDAAASDGPPSASEAAASKPEQGPEQPLWKNLSLELDKGSPTEARTPSAPRPSSPVPPAPAPRKPGLIGAVEVKPSMDDEPTQKPYPSPGESAPSGPPPTRRSESAPPRRHSPSGPLSRDDSLDYDDEDHPRRRGGYSGPPRRDSEPHRGVLIMVLGIISLAAVFLSFCYGVGTLVGIPLGITAWVLGHGDLRKIKNREMDEEGLGMTQAGWICGIIGVILHSLVLLTCGAFIAYFFSLNANSPTTAKPSFGGSAPSAPVLKDQ